MLYVAEVCELSLEAFHERSADESGGFQNAAKDPHQLLLKFEVRCNKI
jgi:hypothetical protein